MSICDRQRRNLEEQMNDLGAVIPLGLADDEVGQARLESSGVVQTDFKPTYTVVRK
jgi:hypothetical protein